MSKIRQRIALGVSLAILVAAAWFWVLQVGDVLETLEMAYG